MVWCSNCTKHQPAQSSRSSLGCCHGCGKVVNHETGAKERKLLAVEQRGQEVKSFNSGKSPKCDVAIFRALRNTVSKNAKGVSNSKGSDDSESLSDIDDTEISRYLLKEDEKVFKKMMWERLNEEYTKAEAARKAAGANAMKLKKEKQQWQAAGTKKARDTAKTTNKRTSSRVNYDALKELLGESETSEKSKKIRTVSYSEDVATSNQNESGHNRFSDWGIIDDDGDEENSAKYQNDPYHDDEEHYYDNDNGDDFF